MTNVLVWRLEGFAELSEDDRKAIELLCAETRTVRSGGDLIREGDQPDKVFLLLKGWGYRYKLLRDGRRQILAYLIPGDLCDLHILVLKKMDHGIGLLGRAEVAAVAPHKMVELMERHPRIARALWAAMLADEAVLREWLVNIGQRDAYEGISHLFYEIWLRMRAVGLAESDRFSLPLTQAELGDTMGLTPVHVNRTLQRLRAEGLITLEHKQLTLRDPERLAEISGFERNYLHLGRASVVSSRRRLSGLSS